MFAEEDQRRLYESRKDIGAVESPAVLTASQEMRNAVVVSRNELSAARTGLRSAAAEVERERNETDVERAKLTQAIETLVRRYGFIRGKVQDALLNVDPDVPVTASEMERRARLFKRAFGLSASDVEREAQGAILEIAGGVAEALATEPDLKPLGYGDSFAAVLLVAKNAQKQLGREITEDSQAMIALRGAREVLDRASLAHELLIESILVREKRREEIGQYVLRRNASYAARRAAKLPMSEEEGAGQVEK